MAELETWASWAEVASLGAILVGGLFALYQVREARRARKQDAMLSVLLQFTADRPFMEAMRHVVQLPPDWSATEPVDGATVSHIDKLYQTTEIMGFMAHRGAIDVADVAASMGGTLLLIWGRLESFVAAERAQNPRAFEWTEWLMGRVASMQGHLGQADLLDAPPSSLRKDGRAVTTG